MPLNNFISFPCAVNTLIFSVFVVSLDRRCHRCTTTKPICDVISLEMMLVWLECMYISIFTYGKCIGKIAMSRKSKKRSAIDTDNRFFFCSVAILSQREYQRETLWICNIINKLGHARNSFMQPEKMASIDGIFVLSFFSLCSFGGKILSFISVTKTAQKSISISICNVGTYLALN